MAVEGVEDRAKVEEEAEGWRVEERVAVEE